MNDSTTVVLKRLLLVDDEEAFRTSLKMSLERSGYEIILAQGGRIAQHILAAEKVDAVISDIRMPDGDGLELVRYAQQAHPDLPFILMTGFADLSETQEAHQLGADVFVAKPFEKQEMLDALASCFSPKPAPGTEIAPEEPLEYCKVAIQDFITGKVLKSDIHIRLSSEKHVKIAHKGEALPTEQIVKYQAKGIRYLYLLKQDFAEYVGMNMNLMHAVTSSQKVSKERKQLFMKHATDVVLERIYSNELNEECFDDAKAVLETSLSLLSEDSAAFNLLGMLDSHSDHLYAHSMGVSIYSAMLARQLHWHSTATISKVSMAGLLHDVGKKEIPTTLLDKPRGEMNSDEIKIYESHCSRGLAILGEIRSVPSDVLQVVLQHHEDCLGQGYPAGLKRQSIHPLARVVSVANAFCGLALKTARGPGLKLADAVPRLLSVYGASLDPALLAGLLKIFKFDIPAHYEAELRKRIVD